MANLYLDPTNGNNTNDGTSFANRVLDITNGITAARTSPGDVIRIMKSEDPVSLGYSATWTNLSNLVTLQNSASALAKEITFCENSWSASPNVTCTTNSSTYKQGTKSSSIAVGSSFTTGILAYYPTGTIDLSTYDKVSFWMRTSNAQSSGVFRIDLCSDTIGAVPVSSMTIDKSFSTNNWKCVTLNNSSSASCSAVQSVSLYAISDPGTPTILLDNILACTKLTLTCVISKNSSATATEHYPIQSISGSEIRLDYHTDSTGGDVIPGYFGPTETVLTYKTEPIRIANSSFTTQDAGDSVSGSLYSGGWDQTNMSTQTGITIIDVQDDSSQCISNSYDYNSFENIVAMRGANSINAAGWYSTYTNCAAMLAGNNSGILLGNYVKVLGGFYSNNSSYGINTNNGAYNLSISGAACNNNGNTGYRLFTNNLYLYSCSANNNQGTAGFFFLNGISVFDNLFAFSNTFGGGIYVGGASNSAKVTGRKLTTSGNTYGVFNGGSSTVELDDVYLTDSTPVFTTNEAIVNISRWNGLSTGMRVYDVSTVAGKLNTVHVHGSTTASIETVALSTRTPDFPLIHYIAPFAVKSTGTLTFSVWVKRQTSANVGARLFLRKNQNAGITTNQIATASAASNTWEQLTITCSPTQNTMLQFELHSWQIPGGGGTASIYWGDFSVTQA